MSETLKAALAALETALYAYSTVAPRLPESESAAARDAYEAIRAQRDIVRQRLVASGVEPPPPPAGYDLGPLIDARAARGVALRVEQNVAAAVAGLISAAEPAARAESATWLVASAVRAVTWRSNLAVSPTTVAFPGLATP